MPLPTPSPFPPFFTLFALAVAALFIIAFVYSYAQGRKRQAEMAALAAQLGFQYFPDMSAASVAASLYEPPKPGGLFSALASAFEFHDPFLDRFGGLYPFGEGYDRKYRNLVCGERNGAAWYAFDYQYTVGSGKEKSTRYYTAVATRQAMIFPVTTIRPETLADRMGAIVGIHDIQFESEEFNNRYNVTSESQRFAYDLIHPQMMEYLMASRGRHLQLGGFYLLYADPGVTAPTEILAAIQDMEGLLALVPEFVRQDIGFEPKWSSPLA